METDLTVLTDLAAERLGGVALAANDEFFAPKECLLKAAAPVWKEGEYTDRGKWMDGWETRRRRTPGHDWCLIRLGLPGIVRAVVVDTAFFRGNYPERCSLEACDLGTAGRESDLREAAWRELLPPSVLRGDDRHIFPVSDDGRVTHLRFNIFPDGGVARLRVHGEVLPDWARVVRNGEPVDLAAIVHGARVVDQSDAFFGNAGNMLLPGRSTHMGDGWETKRRRGPGHDWAVVKLGAPGRVVRIELDTDHFKGNAPGSVSLEASRAPADGAAEQEWTTILGDTPVQPDARHVFEPSAEVPGATHVRLNIHPDGGVARLRLFGTAIAVVR